MYKMLDLTKLLAILTFTIQAIHTACLQFLYLQQQGISALKKSLSYMVKKTLNSLAKEELAWWINNSELSNDQSIIQPPSQILLQTDGSKKGCGEVCQKVSLTIVTRNRKIIWKHRSNRSFFALILRNKRN